MSSAEHVASRTGPAINTSHSVTVSERWEPLTQLFQVSLPAVKAITIATSMTRVAPPESIEATTKGPARASGGRLQAMQGGAEDHEQKSSDDDHPAPP